MRSLIETYGNIDISRAGSEEINKLTNIISTDIINMYDNINENERITDDNTKTINSELLSLNRKIKELEDTLLSLENTILNKNTGLMFLYKSFYSSDGINNINAQQDVNYGLIYPKTSTISKINYKKYPKSFLIKNVGIKVNIYKNDKTNVYKTITLADDPTLIRIFDNNDYNVWIYEELFDNNTNDILLDIEIGLPQNILSNLVMNSVGIKPYPLYSLSLLNVSSYQDNRYVTIPTFRAGNNIDNVKFIFNPLVSNKVSISLKQSEYRNEFGKRKFTIGLRNVDIEYFNTNSQKAEFVTKFDIPVVDKSFNIINTPNLMLIDPSVNVTHELYFDSNLTKQGMFNKIITNNCTTIYVKTIMLCNSNIIPVANGIEIQYSVR